MNNRYMNNIIDMRQPILSYNIDKIIDIIKKIILIDNYKINIFIFYPEKKEWFDKNILFISKILKNNKDLTESLVYYKNYGYLLLNSILINEKLPFILKSSQLTIKNNKTKINTKSLYIFPDDIEKIKLYEKNKILSKINNIDSIFQKRNYLDDCILFRGMNENEYFHDNLNKQTNMKIFSSLANSIIKNKIFKNNENEILFKNYSSFSINPFIPLYFINKYNKSISYFLILKIKKEHNIPGFFLSNIFFNSNINFSSYNLIDYDEFEILISRNLKIKILKIKNIKISKDTKKFLSIKHSYNLDYLKTIKIPHKNIRIIYAESLPFEFPTKPNFDGYKYLCS